MGPQFSWRKTRPNDLAECLDLHPAKNGAEVVGRSVAEKAWQQLLEATHASRSVVVEMHSEGKVKVVGFGLAAFVKKDFANSEVFNPKPGLNSRIIGSVIAGNSVVASYEEVRHANTICDLQQVVLDTSWKNSHLTPIQRDEVRVLLGLSYLHIFSGYRLSRVLTELVDELDIWHSNGHRALQIVDKFESFRLANPETTWNSDRAFALATVESTRANPGSIAAPLFQHRYEPQFAFTRGEQELLEVALDGVDDAAAAQSLFVTVPAIKRRWAKIFERVAAIQPDLCPSDGDGTRGIQKRNRILNYVRNHLEEIRPFDNSLRATKHNLKNGSLLAGVGFNPSV